MRKSDSRPFRGVIPDNPNKPPKSLGSTDRVSRARSSAASAADEEMERCCEEATKLGDDVFWWSFCEESHED